jgi:amino acid permease
MRKIYHCCFFHAIILLKAVIVSQGVQSGNPWRLVGVEPGGLENLQTTTLYPPVHILHLPADHNLMHEEVIGASATKDLEASSLSDSVNRTHFEPREQDVKREAEPRKTGQKLSLLALPLTDANAAIANTSRELLQLLLQTKSISLSDILCRNHSLITEASNFRSGIHKASAAHALPHMHVVHSGTLPSTTSPKGGLQAHHSTGGSLVATDVAVTTVVHSTHQLPSGGAFVIDNVAGSSDSLYDGIELLEHEKFAAGSRGCIIYIGAILAGPVAAIAFYLVRHWVRAFLISPLKAPQVNKPQGCFKQHELHPVVNIFERAKLVSQKSGFSSQGTSKHGFGRGLSVWDGTVAIFSSIVGTGLLAMPFAFSLSGVLGGTCAVLLFSGCSAYTAHLMTWTLGSRISLTNHEQSELQGWPYLVEAAFGSRAKQAITVFLLIELWGYLLSTIISAAMNLHQVAPDLPVSNAVLLTVIVAYALISLPSQCLTWLNVASNLCYLSCCIMFLATGVFLPPKENSTSSASSVELFRPSGLLSAAGMIVFSPAAHSFYPQVMQRMEEPRKFSVCIRRAYVAACSLYLIVAVLGCYTFGAAIQPSVVSNIGADFNLKPIPGLAWMNSAAAFCMVVKMLAMQPLILIPLTATVEGLRGDLFPRVSSERVSFLAPIIILALSALASLHFAEEIAVVLNFLGCVFCMTIAFVVPVLCYWKLTRNPVTPLEQFGFASLLLMGVFFAVGGLVGAF